MPEKAVNQRLNKAKGAAVITLVNAGYKTEKAYNQTFCITAARSSEWRIIAIGIDEIVSCSWFREQIRRLEKYPCPNLPAIQKEVWIRNEGERAFRQFTWKDGRWVDEDLNSTSLFN